ncbi:MAG TPA: CapA family protein [Anaerolineaceae bacterium]|nr:CapA family protein [Anaerolineaceae bacterium]
MFRSKSHFVLVTIAFLFWLVAGCSSGLSLISDKPISKNTALPLATATASKPQASATTVPTETQSPTPARSTSLSIWFSPALPTQLVNQVKLPDWIKPVDQKEQADLQLTALAYPPGTTNNLPVSQWVYALVAPFPTVTDGVSLADLKLAWQGNDTPEFGSAPLLMSANTEAAFAARWDQPNPSHVQIVDAAQILNQAWAKQPSWALVPFENLEPRWKVLSVDGISPVEKNFTLDSYALTMQFGLTTRPEYQNLLSSPELAFLPSSNRDPSKLTVLVLTGTTALVRGTAEKMEEKGITYPAQDIQDWLREADIAHVSNEVPFYPNCPPAVPLRKEMRFCSSPAYFGLLKFAGIDIVELTGNHLLDWGVDPLLYTLNLYRQNNLPFYGGGYNLDQSRQPLLIENHGNKLAFIGCNMYGPPPDWATDTQPGAAPCGDLDWMETAIAQVKSEGYLPIVTFQHFEVSDYKPQSAQRIDFQRIARSGAVIVSGSQAHFPQTMTFLNGNFIHYGLGNLFFDQMMPGNDEEFLDRHIFYDGHYVSTELLTAMLEDYAKPRPMTPAERASLLQVIFQNSEW